MNNLSVEEKGIRSKACFSITGLPISDILYDKWIEITMNKGSKIKAGCISFTENEQEDWHQIKILPTNI